MGLIRSEEDGDLLTRTQEDPRMTESDIERARELFEVGSIEGRHNAARAVATFANAFPEQAIALAEESKRLLNESADPVRADGAYMVAELAGENPDAFEDVVDHTIEDDHGGSAGDVLAAADADVETFSSNTGYWQ